MSKTIIFLHGIGEGDPSRNWLAGLNQGLAAVGTGFVSESDVISPDYSWLLDSSGIKVKHPPITYKVKDDRPTRRAFVRRQARIERLLEQSEMATGFGLRRVPDAVLAPLQKAGIHAGILKQVHNYISQEGLRAAILTQILKTLPSSGDVVLIGHSLGSIIAIDLLDHLPEELHVSRFITVGSPGGARILHDKQERLLKRFPYARVDDWTNFFVPTDPVTAGRGLASVFPGAQDFRIRIPFAKNNPLAHNAEQYLADPAVGMLVADALTPTVDVPATRTNIAGRIDPEVVDALLTLAYGQRIASTIEKKDVAARFEDALKVLSDELVDEVQQRLPKDSSLPAEVEGLAKGWQPDLSRRLELDEAVRRVVTMSFANIIHPYEIEVGDAQTEAIPGFFVDLGFASGHGRRVRDAVIEVQKVLTQSGSFSSGRFAIAAAGLALIAGSPIGLVAAAGAAAIAGGWGSFGSGAKPGGPALLSGLASTGAMVTTAAATIRDGAMSAVCDPASLAILVASSYALKLVGEQPNANLWSSLTLSEGIVAGQINKLAEFSDSKAAQLAQLRQTRDVINRLMEFAHDQGLGMVGIEGPHG